MEKILISAILIILIVMPISYAVSPLGNLFSKIFNWFGQSKPVKVPVTQPIPQYSPQIPIAKPHEDFVQKEYTPINKEYISVVGVSYEKAFNILKSVNPIYINDITKIEFIKTNKDVSNSGDGYYYLDSKSIKIFVGDESDNFLTRVVLHELKHHYCYITNGNVEVNHNGCFLNTPIDKEYGFIR